VTTAFVSRLPAADARRWCDLLSLALGETVAAASEIVGEHEVRCIDVVVINDANPSMLTRFPALRFVQSTWAGVDGLLQAGDFPAVPLARLVDPALAAEMAESALGHVMDLHINMPRYRVQQAQCLWQSHEPCRAADRRVGVLGAGEMGRATLALLDAVGFDLACWARSARFVGGVEVQNGRDGFARVLERSDILVNLLPLTPETCRILDHAALAMMPHGAMLINLGRGGHLDLAAMTAALDSGQLSHAVLDVFEREPLLANDPLWLRADVTITPHVGAKTDPVSASRIIARNIARFRRGEAPDGLVGNGGY
jgi:glyoxylate/hydroxypyruvate reductase A